MMFRVALLVAMVVGSIATYPGYYGRSWSMLPYRRHYGGGLAYGGYGGYGGLGGGYGGYDPYYNMGYNSYYGGDYDPYYYGGGSLYNSYRPRHFGKRGRY